MQQAPVYSNKQTLGKHVDRVDQMRCFAESDWGVILVLKVQQTTSGQTSATGQAPNACISHERQAYQFPCMAVMRSQALQSLNGPQQQACWPTTVASQLHANRALHIHVVNTNASVPTSKPSSHLALLMRGMACIAV